MLKRSYVFILAIGFIPLLLYSCGIGPSSSNTPQEMFEHVVQRPIPPDVTDIQAVGDTWQGYNIWLRFKASKEFIDTLLGTGFEPIGCEEVEEYFSLPEGYDLFEPPWDPHPIQDNECYCNHNASNSWGIGTHYLWVDRTSNTVYFYGIAA